MQKAVTVRGLTLRAAIVLALAVSALGLSGQLASPAQAAACKTATSKFYKHNDFGQITRGVNVSVYFCYDGSKVTYVSRSNTHYQNYLWNWSSWTGSSTLGGVGWSGYRYSVNGEFRECAGYCFRTDYLGVGIQVNGNGTVNTWHWD